MLWFAALCASGTQLGAQCTTNAGTLVPGNFTACASDSLFNVSLLTPPTLDNNDTWATVLHTGTSTTLGTIVAAAYQDSLISFAQVQPGTYQIAVVAGNWVPGTVLPSPADPCYSLAGGATLTIVGGPSVSITGETQPLSCNNPSVDLQATVTPAGGNYTYLWRNQWTGQVISSSPQVTVTTAGSYSVEVTDVSTGCASFDNFFVQATNSYSGQIINTQLDCEAGGNSMLRCSTAQAFGSNLAYAWSSGQNTQEIEVSTATAQTYTVTVTNVATGCTLVLSRDVQPNLALSVGLIYYPAFSCIDSFSGIFAEVLPQSSNLLQYEWSNGLSGSYLPTPLPGTYTVTVTNSTWNCSVSASIVIEDSPFDCGELKGQVWGDMDSNCATSAGDIELSQVIVRVTPVGGGMERWAVTNVGGQWSMSVDPGQYEVEVGVPSDLWSACQATYTLTVGPDESIVQDFYLQPDELCARPTVDIASSWLVRCFNGNYFINYFNTGTQAVQNAYVDVVLDPFLTFNNSTPLTATNLGNNTWRFQVGDLEVNESGWFSINVQVSCNAVLGQTHCTEATIHPYDPTCGEELSQWNGASLQIEGAQCDGDSVTFRVKNVGNATNSQPLEYVVIEDAVMFMAAPPPTIFLAPQDTYDIKVDANGATWRLNLEQEANHPGNSQPTLAVEGCAAGTNFSTGFVTQFAENDADFWIDIDCEQNVGSYDPNDKQGFPKGYGADHQIEPNTDLEYLIRFQNTGTAPAYTVVIRDTLSAWLDPATIQFGAASHPYKVEFYGEGPNLKFTFDDINLPDSASNFEGSIGFVSFRIGQVRNVPLGTDVFNTAAIFFDFNEPIFTNTTQHRVDSAFIVVSAWEPLAANIQLGIAPNPMGDVATITLRDTNANLEFQIELIDQLGRVVRTGQSTTGNWLLRRGSLPSGTYTLRVRTERGLAGIGKVMLK
jgi:uncharacterized repeat protein (TIGR01451 family)